VRAQRGRTASPKVPTELPPSVRLLLSEYYKVGATWPAFNRLLEDKSFTKEASRQANFTTNDPQHLDRAREKARPGELHICPTGSLSPISNNPRCRETACHANTTIAFAKTVGLYGEKVVLRDTLTLEFLSPPSDSYSAHRIYNKLVALDILLPLIREGIVEVYEPEKLICPECAMKTARTSGLISSQFNRVMNSDANIRLFHLEEEPEVGIQSTAWGYEEGSSMMTFGLTAGEEALLRGSRAPQTIIQLSKGALKKPFLRERIRRRLMLDASEIVNDLEFASATRSAPAGPSMGSPSSLFQPQAKRSTNRLNSEQIDALKGLLLPWVENVSVEDVLRIRNRAKSALPRFRSQMAAHIASITSQRPRNEADVENVHQQLRSEVSELQTELAESRRGVGRLIPASLAGGAIAWSILGSPGIAATFVAGLVALRNQESNHRHRTQKLSSTPAYVLFTADAFSRHARPS